MLEYVVGCLGEALQDSFYGLQIFLNFLAKTIQNILRLLSSNFSSVPITTNLEGDNQLKSAKLSTENDHILKEVEMGKDTFYCYFFSTIGFLCFLARNFMYMLLNGISDSSSIVIHVILAAVMLYIVNRWSHIHLQQYAKGITLMAAIFLCAYMSAIDSIQKSILMETVRIKSIHALLERQVTDSNNYSAIPYRHRNSLIEQTLFENATWTNVALKSFWEISKDEVYAPHELKDSIDAVGGLGPYVSECILVALTTELEHVPPGMGNMRIKSLSLGSQPPLIRDIHLRSIKAEVGGGTHTKSAPKKASVTPKQQASPERKYFQRALSFIGNSLNIKWEQVRSKTSDAFRNGRNQGVKMLPRRALDRLVMELDFVFISKDLNFVVSLR